MTEREIFTAALNQQNPAERAAFLDEACAGDAQMRRRVESLLTEHQELAPATSFEVLRRISPAVVLLERALAGNLLISAARSNPGNPSRFAAPSV
jgi:hypothetical protein